MAQPRIFILEGILGAGKTTLVAELKQLARQEKWEADVCWASEPVEEFAGHANLPGVNPLQEFYRGDLPAVVFQMHASHTILRRDACVWTQLAESGAKTVVAERCLASSRAFQTVLAEGGRLSPTEHAVAQTQIDVLEGTPTALRPRDSTLIYLSIDPALAADRIRQRARPGEEEVTLDYLVQLDRAMRARHGDYKFVHRLMIRPGTTPAALASIVGSIVRGRVRQP